MNINNIQTSMFKKPALLLVASWGFIFIGAFFKIMFKVPQVSNTTMLLGVIGSATAVCWAVYKILKS